MKKILKFLLAVMGVLVLLLVAAAVILPMVYDTEKIKATASEAVKKQTGRDLVIDGDLKFSVFPTLALEINDVSLGNAQQALERLERVGGNPQVDGYGPFHIARAEVLRRLDRREEADQSDAIALKTGISEPVMSLLQERLKPSET